MLVSTIDGTTKECQNFRRFPARHFGDADPEDAEPRGESRVWHRDAHPAGVRRGAEGGGGLALPGAATAAAGRADRSRVGRHGEQTARALLPHHGGGTEAAGGGEAQIFAGAGRNRARDGGGMRVWKRIAHWRNRRRFEEDLAEEIRVHREM